MHVPLEKYPQLDENVELSSDPHTVGKRTLPAIYTCVNLYGILRWCQLLLKFTIGFMKSRYFMKNDYLLVLQYISTNT